MIILFCKKLEHIAKFAGVQEKVFTGKWLRAKRFARQRWRARIETLRETLQTVERMEGVMPNEGVNPVYFPEVCRAVWGWFLQLLIRPADVSIPRSG